MKTIISLLIIAAIVAACIKSHATGFLIWQIAIHVFALIGLGAMVFVAGELFSKKNHAGYGCGPTKEDAR